MLLLGSAVLIPVRNVFSVWLIPKINEPKCRNKQTVPALFFSVAIQSSRSKAIITVMRCLAWNWKLRRRRNNDGILGDERRQSGSRQQQEEQHHALLESRTRSDDTVSTSEQNKDDRPNTVTDNNTPVAKPQPKSFAEHYRQCRQQQQKQHMLKPPTKSSVHPPSPAESATTTENATQRQYSTRQLIHRCSSPDASIHTIHTNVQFIPSSPSISEFTSSAVTTTGTIPVGGDEFDKTEEERLNAMGMWISPRKRCYSEGKVIAKSKARSSPIFRCTSWPSERVLHVGDMFDRDEETKLNQMGMWIAPSLTRKNVHTRHKRKR